MPRASTIGVVVVACGFSGLPRLPSGTSCFEEGRTGSTMSESQAADAAPADGSRSPLSRVANAMVALHKEQFGRGPTRARATYAGDNTLVCTLEDALLPAERTMVD